MKLRCCTVLTQRDSSTYWRGLHISGRQRQTDTGTDMFQNGKRRAKSKQRRALYNYLQRIAFDIARDRGHT